jgi:NIPSNAP
VLYEMRSIRVRPGGIAEFEGRLEAALPARLRHSPLAGCWHTEIGPLMQIVELWVYEDRRHHAEVADAVRRDGTWPGIDGVLATSAQTEILEMAPFIRDLDGTPQQPGPVYEMRLYQIKDGTTPALLERWEPMVPRRQTISPLLAVLTSEFGSFIHLWAYRSLAHRDECRDEVRRLSIWPPNSTEFLLTQENKILLPASFSPLT